MKIKDIEIKGFAALAPMAGVADRAMREICASFGAGFTVGELTSAKGVIQGDKKSARLLECFDSDALCASQLFGRDPFVMAEAVLRAEELRPDFIDINMGCPAPKVAGHGGGSALMKEPRLAAEIVKQAVNKYGLNNFLFIILETIDINSKDMKSELIKSENKYLNMYLPNYNILKNAYTSLGYKHTEESRQLMKEN